MTWLRINIPVGTVAALLTTLEYLIGTLAALCARALLHGLWLLSLHREQELALHAHTRQKRSLCKDALGFLLGIWLVIGVALVESSLQTGFVIQDTVLHSPNCVSMFGNYKPQRLTLNKPPYSAGVQPWIYKVAKALRCENTGLATLGVGGQTDQAGMLQNTSAPICAPSSTHLSQIIAEIGDLVYTPRALHFKIPASDSFVIFPLNNTSLGIDHTSLTPSAESTGPCATKHISSFVTRIPTIYQTATVHSENMTRSIWHTICTLHNHPVQSLPISLIHLCQTPTSLSVKCLRAHAAPSHLFTVTLPNTSALFVGRDLTHPSFACPRSTLHLEYLFIPPEIITALLPSAFPRLPILIPTLLRPTTGHCERTIAPLGQAALLYSAASLWTMDDLSTLPDLQRYYAYLLSVSASIFPLNDLPPPESSTHRGKCYTRPIRAVTEIQSDWRLIVLLTGLSISMSVIVSGIAFRAWFLKAWRVGSAQWSLDRMMESSRGPGKQPVHEVVSVRPVDTGLKNRRDSLNDDDWQDGIDEHSVATRSFVNVVGAESIYAFNVRAVERAQQQ